MGEITSHVLRHFRNVLAGMAQVHLDAATP